MLLRAAKSGAVILAVAYFDQNREQVAPETTLRRALAPHGDSVMVRGEGIHVVSWARQFLFDAAQLAMSLGMLSRGNVRGSTSPG